MLRLSFTGNKGDYGGSRHCPSTAPTYPKVTVGSGAPILRSSLGAQPPTVHDPWTVHTGPGHPTGVPVFASLLQDSWTVGKYMNNIFYATALHRKLT